MKYISMKDRLKLFGALLLALVGVQFVGCSEDDSVEPENEIPVDVFNFGGEISEDVTLPAANYSLTSPLIITNNATVTFEAGANIIARNSGLQYISVSQGAKLVAIGEADKPVIFTSESKNPGSWGGIIIHGQAPTNQLSITNDYRPGEPYGGGASDDNSGTLSYVRIEYAGANLTDSTYYGALNPLWGGGGTRGVASWRGGRWWAVNAVRSRWATTWAFRCWPATHR